jgi:AcrR family transcriptional regulator
MRSQIFRHIVVCQGFLGNMQENMQADDVQSRQALFVRCCLKSMLPDKRRCKPMAMGKIDRNKKQKEHSLLNTAFTFFTTKGFSKTSISDIAEEAGVAKGTFYLYFKDKYDIRNRLISHKSSQLFRLAAEDLKDEIEGLDFEEKLIRIVDDIINQLNADKSLLTFIAKNLSWGIFKSALTSPSSEEDIDFTDVYYAMLEEAPYRLREPEIMLFMIVELVSATCYSAILYEEPCSMEALKPHLYETIRLIIRSQRCEITESDSKQNQSNTAQ